MASNGSKAVVSFIVGAAVGVAVGYFLNSDKKDELVDKLKYQADKLKDKLKKKKEQCINKEFNKKKICYPIDDISCSSNLKSRVQS